MQGVDELTMVRGCCGAGRGCHHHQPSLSRAVTGQGALRCGRQRGAVVRCAVNCELTSSSCRAPLLPPCRRCTSTLATQIRGPPSW